MAITGAGFGATQGNSTISLNGASVAVANWSDTAITAAVPANASSGPFSITVNGQTTSSSSFTVTTLPWGWLDSDIGSVGISGSGNYVGGTFTVKGAGQQIYGTSDSFHFSYLPLAGDGTIVARVVSTQGLAGYGSAGVMIRETLNSGSVNSKIADWPAYGSIYFDLRTTTGGSTSEPGSGSATLPYWVKVVRSGNSFSTYMSANGTNWTQVASTQTVTMAQNVYIGLGVTSGSTSILGTATFDNVSVTSPSSVIPVITSVSATMGSIGDQVTINGSGFGTSEGSSLVMLNGAPVTVNSWSDTAIVITIPAGATSGLLQVALGSGTNESNPINFTVIPPWGWLDSDIGPVGISGSGNYVGDTFTVKGAGQQIYGSSDSFHFSYLPLAGDGTIVARLVSTQGFAGFGSAGVMIRETLNSGSINGKIADWPAYGIYFDLRTITGGSTSEPGSGSATLPCWLKVVRSGSSFSTYMSANGTNWTQLGSTQTVTMAQNVYIGLGVTSGSTSALGTVTFDNILVTAAAPPATVPPAISSVGPTIGGAGTSVSISGSNFGPIAGTVTFNGAPAILNSWNSTHIVVTVPGAATSGNIVVTSGGLSSNGLAFTMLAPTITSVTPTSGAPGTSITIAGTSFGSSAGMVTFNGQSAPISSWSASSITVTVPGTATTGNIVVNDGGLPSNGSAFTVAPIIGSVTPAVGAVRSVVTIAGANFTQTQGTVTFGGQAATISSWSNTSIVATVPTTTATGPVSVTAGGMASNTNITFTVPPPQIASIAPNIGGTGNPITITGSGFQDSQGSGSVSFYNEGIAPAISSWSDTQIVATVPRGTNTGPVKIYAANNQVSNSVNYTVPNLTVNTLSPYTGPVGTQVTINGAGFGTTQGTSVLTFNGQAPSSIASWGDTQIVATVPVTSSTGPVKVTVNNINSNNDLVFTVPAPSLYSLTPTGGTVGTTVTITGLGFQPYQRDSTVTFNGVPASITSWSDTQIVTSVPPGAATGSLSVIVNSVSGSYRLPFEVPNLVVSALAPQEAPVGGVITITGTGFGPSDWYSPDGNSRVYTGFATLNGVNMDVRTWSDTSITVAVPSNASSGSLVVSKYDGTSNAVQLTVEGAPTVTAVSPAMAPVGATVSITGTGFGPSQSSNTVKFFAGTNATGPNAAVVSWSDTQIVATVPPGTATGPVGVVVATVGGPTSNFVLNTTVQVTDSLGHISSYTSAMLGGNWYNSSSTGSGCSSCTVRGTLNNTLDSAGNRLSHSDELGHVTSYTYDANNNLASQSAQLDANTPVATSYTYNSFGEPLTVTDPLGNVTTNTYDANGNLLTVTSPKPDAPTAASVAQFAYDAKGQLTQITDPLNHITTLAYYPTGLIHTITDAQSNVTSYEYDLRGNRTAVVDAQQNRTTFAYDLGNRLTGITYPDTTSVSFAYDTRGRRTSVTDQNGKVTSYAYDDADRLTSVTDAAQNITHYAYDLENNLTSITDAAQHTTSFVYDAFGRVTQTAFPSSLTENYVYDAVGNLTSKIDRKNQTIQYAYNALNRLTHKGYPDATGVDYVYDLAGKIKQVSDPTGSYGFAYDNMGRLIGTTTQYSFLPGTPAPTFSNSYAYDATSNRTSFTAPDGSNDTYSYDTLNRLNTLTDSGAGLFSIGYDALGRRTQLTRPNGITTSYGYDSVSHLQSVLHKLGVNTLDGATNTYDSVGHRTSKTNQLNSTVSNYGYDNIYQLTGVTQGASSTEAYSFDPVGNRLSSLLVPSYTYNGSNEVTAAGSASYTYDNNGNALTKTDSTGTMTYTWDFENRLTSVHPPSQPTVTFKYDPFGRRIQKGGSVYMYDGANLIEEADAAGNLVARYVFGSGIDESLAASRGATWEFYQADGLGSITSLSTTTGTVSDSFVYDSFGNVTSSTGTFAQPFRYTGREWDAETGLYYYRARYYDAPTGRFVSEDPIRFASDTTNFYAYVGNDPVDESDPFGLCPPDKQCFAQLKCRTVNDWRALGRQHCFWYVQGSNGIQYILGAGPNPPNGNNRMLNIWRPNPNTQTGVDNRGAGTAWDSGLSAANCPGVDAMIAAANGWPQNTIPYHEVTGPNSDTAAHYLGTRGGFNPPAPSGVMGWNTPLPPGPTPTPTPKSH